MRLGKNAQGSGGGIGGTIIDVHINNLPGHHAAHTWGAWWESFLATLLTRENLAAVACRGPKDEPWAVPSFATYELSYKERRWFLRAPTRRGFLLRRGWGPWLCNLAVIRVECVWYSPVYQVASVRKFAIFLASLTPIIMALWLQDTEVPFFGALRSLRNVSLTKSSRSFSVDRVSVLSRGSPILDPTS